MMMTLVMMTIMMPKKMMVLIALDQEAGEGQEEGDNDNDDNSDNDKNDDDGIYDHHNDDAEDYDVVTCSRPRGGRRPTRGRRWR